jgi:hypothetical protein
VAAGVHWYRRPSLITFNCTGIGLTNSSVIHST